MSQHPQHRNMTASLPVVASYRSSKCYHSDSAMSQPPLPCLMDAILRDLTWETCLMYSCQKRFWDKNEFNVVKSSSSTSSKHLVEIPDFITLNSFLTQNLFWQLYPDNIIVGIHVTIIPDHQYLLWLWKSDTRNTQLVHWREVLEEFNEEIIHQLCKLHTNTIGLFCLPRDHSIDSGDIRSIGEIQSLEAPWCILLFPRRSD